MKPFHLFVHIIALCSMLVGTSIFLKLHFIRFPLPKQLNIPAAFQAFSLLISSPFAWLACFCGISGILVWMIVLNKVELSLAYPMVSLSYVLMAIASFLIFHESISVYKIIGIILICGGMIVINR